MSEKPNISGAFTLILSLDFTIMSIKEKRWEKVSEMCRFKFHAT